MSNIQAALGCAQLERVDELVSRKRQILDRYKSSFSRLGLDDCSFNLESPNTRIGAWMVNCVFNFLNPLSSPSSHILSSLNHSDIAARPFCHLSSTPPFANYKSLHKEQSIAITCFPKSRLIFRRTMILPTKKFTLSLKL